jgi:hypothetical protein
MKKGVATPTEGRSGDGRKARRRKEDAAEEEKEEEEENK